MGRVSKSVLGVVLALLLVLAIGCETTASKRRATGRRECSKCGFIKEAPECCKDAKKAAKRAALCTKCGEPKGSAVCCKPKGRVKCAKCGLFKGSPGCCKIK